jgi:GGDEF domain-containing protein
VDTSTERSERLRAESYQDSLTGLSNRRYFEMQFVDGENIS